MAIPMRNSSIGRLYFHMNRQNNLFDWDKLTHAPISSYLTGQEVEYFHNLAVNAKYASIGMKKKIDMMSEVLNPKGFVFMTNGTNRVVYRCDYDQSFLLKIALDRVGVDDSMREYYNQQLLKPFVPKVFDVSKCGTIGLIERVEPIRNRHEFASVADQIFDVMNKKILGRYVLEDIGTKYFKNWGLRDGFGPVLLDFPYVYEIDGNKLTCNAEISKGVFCDGMIDYDDGFNNLVCEKCGQRHAAKNLGKANGVTLVTKHSIERRNSNMYNRIEPPVVRLQVGDKFYGDVQPQKESPNGDQNIKNRPQFWNGYGLKTVLDLGSHASEYGGRRFIGDIPNNAPPNMVLHNGFFVDRDLLERKADRDKFRKERIERSKQGIGHQSKKEPRVQSQKVHQSKQTIQQGETMNRKPKGVVIDTPIENQESTTTTTKVEMKVEEPTPTKSTKLNFSYSAPPHIRTDNLTQEELDRLSIGFQGTRESRTPEVLIKKELENLDKELEELNAQRVKVQAENFKLEQVLSGDDDRFDLHTPVTPDTPEQNLESDQSSALGKVIPVTVEEPGVEEELLDSESAESAESDISEEDVLDDAMIEDDTLIKYNSSIYIKFSFFVENMDISKEELQSLLNVTPEVPEEEVTVLKPHSASAKSALEQEYQLEPEPEVKEEEPEAEEVVVEEKEVNQPDSELDLSSAAERTKLQEVMLDETEIFLESIGEQDIQNMAQRNDLEYYIFNQLKTRYKNSDEQMLKQIVKNFVEDVYDNSIGRQMELEQSKKVEVKENREPERDKFETKKNKTKKRAKMSEEARKKARMKF